MVTRYHAWSPLSDRRIVCPSGHQWSPDAVIRSGHAEAMCRQCRTPLLVVALPAMGCKLVLEGTRAEWEALGAKGLGVEASALWLVTHKEAA